MFSQTQPQSYSDVPSTIQTSQADGIVAAWWLTWIIVIIIIELATPFGVLFPTDGVIFAAWLYYGAHPMWGWFLMLCSIMIAATIFADWLGYRRWSYVWVALLQKEDTRYFKKKYIYMWQKYFEEYWNRALYISRFLPSRSIIAPLAGMLGHNIGIFMIHSSLSAIVWIVPLLGLSYGLTHLVPWASRYIGVLTFCAIVIPQLIAWRFMLRPAIKKYELKILEAKQNIDMIAHDISDIWSQLGQVAKKIIE